MSNTVKVESYNQGKSITLTVEEGQEYFLFCLFDSNKKIVGNPFESQIVSNVGSHEVIELASKLPDVTEPDTYKLYVSAKHKDKTIGEPVTLPWKEVGAKVITPPPSPSDPDTDKVKEIQTRLNDIESDLDATTEVIHDAKNPNRKNFTWVDGMIGRMRVGMKEILTIVASIEKSKPTECTGFKDQMAQISKKMEQLEDMCRGLKRMTANKSTSSAKAPVANPDPAPAVPDTDPDPTNTRIDGLKKELEDLALQLADKASSKDLTNLSGSVNNLRAQVTSLEGQMSGLETATKENAETVNKSFNQLMAAVGALGNQQVPATIPTTVPPALVTTQKPSPVQGSVPTPVNRKSKKSFLTWVLGLTVIVITLTCVFGLTFMVVTGIIFSAPRPQSTTPMIIGVPASQPNSTTPPEATVTPVTPPPAPAPLPKMSPEKLEKMRTEIRAQQESVLSAYPNLAVRSHDSTKPSQEGSVVNINGNGNVVGKNVTINNNYQDPKTDSDLSDSYVPSTFHTSGEVGPGLVQTGHWSPTRLVNTVQVENPYGPGTGYVH